MSFLRAIEKRERISINLNLITKGNLHTFEDFEGLCGSGTSILDEPYWQLRLYASGTATDYSNEDFANIAQAGMI